VNNGTKVKLRHIPCDHWFENRPQKLMIGQLGCPKCRYNRAGESHPQKKSTEQWIAEARETHGDLYIYHSEYTNNKGMMDIECTICDTKFSQEAKSHATYGQGCPKCRYVKSAAGIRLNFDEILKRLETRRQETGKHYRYPNLTAETYTSASHKYEIVCPDCNRTFQQTLAKHIDRRQGCGACSTTGFQPDQLGYYYVHKILNESGDILMYKGGISGNWQQRLQTLRRGIPDHLTMELHEVIEFEIGQEALDLETTLLRMAAEEGWKAPSRKFDGGCELFLENPLDHARSHVLI
jgi:ribosomal protein S27AE